MITYTILCVIYFLNVLLALSNKNYPSLFGWLTCLALLSQGTFNFTF